MEIRSLLEKRFKNEHCICSDKTKRDNWMLIRAEPVYRRYEELDGSQKTRSPLWKSEGFVRVDGKYKGLCRCNKCGKEWFSQGNYIYNLHGSARCFLDAYEQVYKHLCREIQDYKTAIENAQTALEETLLKKNEVEREIAMLKSTLERSNI